MDDQQILDAAWSLVLAELTDDPALTGAVLESCDDIAAVAVALAGMMAGAVVQFSGGDREDAAQRVATTIGQPLQLTPHSWLSWSRGTAPSTQREKTVDAGN